MVRRRRAARAGRWKPRLSELEPSLSADETPRAVPDATTALYFRFFNEIGIIAQLATALLEARLADGLLAPHFAVLNHLVRVEDGRTPLSMAQAFQVPKTSMTHQVRVLERLGLVHLTPNEADGRSKKVWLTDEGRAMRERAIADLAVLFGSVAAVVPPEDVADLVPQLERLRRHLDATREPGP